MTINPTRRQVLQGAAAIAGSTIFAPALHATPVPIRLGTLASLEGPLAINGQDAYRVIELLLEEADYKAGGRKIEWIRESSNAKPDVALARTRKLIEQDHADVVIGPLSGAEGIAVRDYSRTVPNKTFINGSSASQDNTLRNSSPNYFRFSTDGTQWTAGLGEYTKNTLKIDEVTVVASDYAFPYSQVFGFSLEFTRAGGKLNYLWTPFGTSDYTSLIAQIPKSSGALYVVYGGSDGLAFLTQYAQAGGCRFLAGPSLPIRRCSQPAAPIARCLKAPFPPARSGIITTTRSGRISRRATSGAGAKMSGSRHRAHLRSPIPPTCKRHCSR